MERLLSLHAAHADHLPKGTLVFGVQEIIQRKGFLESEELGARVREAIAKDTA